MAMPAPTRLGPYEILSRLGKGGMGEVWKARDTRLNRDVAIKISAQQFTDRFEREARAIAALNHPNICTLYDVGPNYLVMELVEGPTLAEHIAQGPIPLEEALGIAKQIADALEAAHEKNIVHRDLKPANIKIKPDGRVKVLDFGLAKSGELPALTSDSPTMMSVPGMILGTAAYMSPEQARAKDVDKRADIWAFGVVLYEMLTGKRLFEGETISDTLAAVIKEDPDLTKVPAKVQRLLRRCLEKDPKKRLRDITGAEFLLEAVEPPAVAHSRLPWIAAALLAVSTIALALVHFREKPLPVAPISSAILPPETTAFDFAGQFNPPALSPDGKWIVFGARTTDNKNPLWIRPLASTTAQMLAGTEGAVLPFWSPDGRYVAFFAGGKLKKIDVSGGPALAIADAPNARGGSWSPEGIILFAPSNATPLQKVAASGGTPSPATSLEEEARSHRFPWFLPDGRHFLLESESGSNPVLRTGSLDSLTTVALGSGDSNAIYSRGHLLFLRENTLMAQPFDERRRTMQGEAVPVAEQVSYLFPPGNLGVFTVSASGLLAYQTGGSFGSNRLTWFDRGGKTVSTFGEGYFPALDLSPDGKNAAVSAVDATGNQDIWIYDIVRGFRTRFTFDPSPDRRPVWSTDGSMIVWDRRKGAGQLYRKAADGKGTEELILEGAGVSSPSGLSPDGRFLLFNRITPGMQSGVWSLPFKPEKPGSPLKPFPLVDTAFNEADGVFSPDGHWVAYESNESAQAEVYVVPFPGSGGKHQISTAGGRFPRWRRDGKGIFYAALDGNLMAAEVALKAGSIEVGQVRPLGIQALLALGMPYDVSPDGQRILAIADPEHSASPPLTLVENWTALLKK
jgi:eukaryotic-like serine/threonine-protein kinase